MSKKINPTPIPSVICGIRSMLRISQTAFSEIVGFSQSKLSRIEKGEVSLKKGDADRIAKALGVTPQVLFPTIEGHDGGGD